MRAMLALLAGLVATAACAPRACASEEWAYEAFQPIWTANEIRCSRVTRLTFNSVAPGAMAVLATCDSSLVPSDSGPVQRNAAFAVGLETDVTFTQQNFTGLFGDTLRVVLRATRPPADLGDFSFEQIAEITVQCLLANAAQSPEIRYVALRGEGADSLRRLGGLFSTKRYRSGPLTRRHQ